MIEGIVSVRAAVAGRYEIEREIGQGAFATVYLARDLRHDRHVAFKVLNADATVESGEGRFLREIRLLAQLQHPNILPLIDSGHADGQLYYVMPYVKGESLRQRIEREGQLVLDAAVGITREIADALACAHQQGIIHRDIKPENILLSAGHPVVADFGVARAIDVAGVRQLTRTGAGNPGTPAYMSPEQLLGDNPVEDRSDLYSLACVLYEMLSGTPPFPGKDGLVKRFTEEAPRISARRRDVSRSIDAVVSKALAREPADRYASAHDFSEALASATRRANLGSAAPAPELCEDADARDSYLIARRIVQRRARSEYPTADRELANAIKREPAFAKAHALQGVLALLRAGQELSQESAVEAGLTTARRALDIDRSLSEAHAVVGLAATLAWDWPVASTAFESAVASDSPSALTYHWYGLYLCALGKTAEAQNALREATLLEEGNATLHASLGLAAFYHRDGTTAIIALERSCALEPANAMFPAFLGLAHSLVGEHDRALSRYTQAVELANRLDPFISACRVWTLSRAGRRDEALAERAHLTSTTAHADVSPFLEAAAAASLGETEEALVALRRAAQQHDGWLLSLRVHPWMDPLRSANGFSELIDYVVAQGEPA